MTNYPSTLTSSIIVPSRLVFFMWAVHSLNFFLGIYLGKFAIIPREPIGLIGIVMAPLIHVNHLHLISNTFPVLFLGTTLYYFYDRIANKVFLICYFITGALVWILGRPPSHVGASGLIYGLAFFLIFLGIFRKDIKITDFVNYYYILLDPFLWNNTFKSSCFLGISFVWWNGRRSFCLLV